MTPGSLVAGRDEDGVAVAPGLQDAVDRLRGQLQTVGEDDHGGVGSGCQRRQAAPERRAGAQLPFRAVHHPHLVEPERVRPGDDDDLVDRCQSQPFQDARQQELLLGRAESGSGSGSEDDRPDPRRRSSGHDARGGAGELRHRRGRASA